MTRRRTHPNAGFALLTVVMLVAVFTISALVVVELINSDIKSVGVQHRAEEARATAEGGLMEVLNDHNTMESLPTLSSPNLKATYTVDADSNFAGSSPFRGTGQYTADFQLVRVAPLLESSHNVVRAVVYEVNVESQMDSGSSARVQAEVYRVVASKAGVVQPRMHAR